MKKTQFTEMLRLIRNTFVLFVSIIVVSALGSATFCGLSYSSTAVYEMADRYYKNADMYDLKLVSAGGFTAEDIKEIMRTDGVSDVYAGYFAQELISVGDTKIAAEFFTQSDRINKADIKDGRLPENETECVIELPLSKRFGLKIGDVITTASASGMLTSDTFKITGIAELPLVLCIDDYNNRGVASVGNGQTETLIILDKVAFDTEAYIAEPVCYVKLSGNGSFFSEEYHQAAKAVKDKIELLGSELEKQKYDENYSFLSSEIKDAETEYQKNRDEYEAALAELEALEASLGAGAGALAEYQRSLDGSKALLDKSGEYIRALRDYLAELEAFKWTVTDIESNPSYHNFTTNINGMDSVKYTCCLLLLMISTLVCYTTIGRMVTEQRRFIGTQKALGFKESEIYKKYIYYAGICSLLGVIAGQLLGYFAIEKIVFSISYSAAYQTVDFIPAFEVKPAVIIALGELICAVLAAYFACHNLIKESAISLLNDGMRSIKYKENGTSTHFSINIRMALRNILANKNILTTTIVGVSGCTILLITVFSVRSAMSGITHRQYEELQHYDGVIVVNSGSDQAESDSLTDYLNDNSSFNCLNVCEKYCSFVKDDEYHYATLIASADGDFSSYINIYEDIRTGREISVPDDGVLISKKISEEYGYNTGGDIIITDSKGDKYTARVAGIFERNIGNALIISPEYYGRITGKELDFYEYYVRFNTDDIDRIISELNSFSAFVSYTSAGIYVEEFNYKLTCVDSAVLVILAAALILSVFVLFNLANMNISSKETEITVMKVMGFSATHIKGYVLREEMLMSFLGLVVGVLIGAPVGAYISKAIELEGIQNIRGISIRACLIGAGISCVFFTAANALSLISIRRIKMTGNARQA